jgi:CRISPR-associated endoribonuclease Cas6
MPHSLVVNFIPATPIYPQFLSGRHLHALFLTLVSSVDKELADALHSDRNNKAFTLSPLQIGSDRDTGNSDRRKPKPYPEQEPTLRWEYKQPIPAGLPIWWRISLLDDQLFGKLTKLWLHLNPSHPWHLGSADLAIASILGTPQSTQPWANFSPYQQIYDLASDTERTIALRFYTPTAFRQGKYDSLLPTKESVFSSLCDRWNTYCSIAIDKAKIMEPLFASRFNIHTEVVSNYGSSFIGCVGEISFRILGDVDSNTIKQINTLAEFAMYGGVGRKTAMGMGMVKRVVSC